KVLADDCAHRVADEMRLLDSERLQRTHYDIDQVRYRELRVRGRTPRARQIRPHYLEARRQQTHLRREDIRCSPKTMQHDERIAGAIDLHRHPFQHLRGHDSSDYRTRFSNTLRP